MGKTLFAISTAALMLSFVAGAAIPPVKPVLQRPQRSRLIRSN